MSRMGSCKVTGSREMRARLAALIRAYPVAIKRAIKEEAEFIMADSKEKYVPVASYRGGTLKQSGVVLDPVVEGGNIYVVMGYGGAAMPYAEAVHEHVSRHSPPSWKGLSINWNVPGTGPKYLEIPFRNAQRGQANRIAASIRAQVG